MVLSIMQQLEYGFPIAVIVIVIAAIVMWRSGKKAGKSSGTASSPGKVINEALIISPNANMIVDRKTFEIRREFDPIQNIEATYAMFPEETTAKKGGFGNVIEGFKKMFRMGSNNPSEDQEKKGRPFNPNMAAIKIGGGWFAIYTLESNTQIPLTSPERPMEETIEGEAITEDRYKYLVQIPISTTGEYTKIYTAIDHSNKEVKDAAPLQKRETYLGLMRVYILEMERNVERRIANLKAAQNATLDWVNANKDMQNLGKALTIGFIALMIAILVLAIVLSQLPGTIHTILTQTLGSFATTIGQGASIAGKLT